MRRRNPRTKRLFFWGDRHCGAHGGLTPPAFQHTAEREDITGEAWATMQQHSWDWTVAAIKECGPVDLAVDGGDCIDGLADKSAGTELITTNLKIQREIAAESMRLVDANAWAMVAGTGYHSSPNGQDEDANLAEEFGADFKDHHWIECNGAIFSVKHHCGGSQSTGGGDAYLRQEILWTHEWAIRHGWDIPHQILRFHVHRHRQVDHAQSMPCLQTWTQFGGRRCRNYITPGVAWCDVTPKGDVHWTLRLMPLAVGKPTLLHV